MSVNLYRMVFRNAEGSMMKDCARASSAC